MRRWKEAWLPLPHRLGKTRCWMTPRVETRLPRRNLFEGLPVRRADSQGQVRRANTVCQEATGTIFQIEQAWDQSGLLVPVLRR